MKRYAAFMSAAAVVGGAIWVPACRDAQEDASNAGAGDGTGSVSLMLLQAPADASCLRVRVEGSRTVTRLVSLTPGQSSSHKLSGLPTGAALFSAEAFSVPCGAIHEGLLPAWVTETPVVARVDALQIVDVLIRLIRNGRANVAVDFDDGTPALPQPAAGACAAPGGVFSSQSAYMTAVGPGVFVKPILTVGDAVGTKPDGTPYRMVGIPDGQGAFDNGDGTFTLLVNHELGASVGTVRAHGAKGAFVSRWIVRKCDLAVLKGEDLIKQVVTWSPVSSSYEAPATGGAFGRFCAAELALPSAFNDPASATGHDGRLFTNGEETGTEGRAFAHAMDGTSYELPRMGKYSFENVVANPGTGKQTVVAGLDDSGGGQVYIYYGTKTAAGSPVDRAGLTNGVLYGVKVEGVPMEDPATGIPSGTKFTLAPLGNVENTTGAALETASNTALITKLQRPEDGNWDAKKPNHFYFVTTASFTGATRLWRLRFKDINDPAAGGHIDMLLDGSEGPKMMDNITVDDAGKFVYLQEDPGGQDYLAKIWRYDLATDAVVVVSEHDAGRFQPGVASPLLTRDEESSGILDASSFLGAGWFLGVVQAHAGQADPELVEHGQLFAIWDPAAAKK